MTAQEATKVDVTGVKGSSVVRARLTVTSTGKGVAGKDVTMTLRDDGSDVYGASTRTQSDGKAALDLKGRLEAQAVVGLARANSFTASFDGDGQYCGSADDAVFRIVKTGL